MINDQIYKALQIRYVKLHFKIVFLNHAELPVNKVSALRGGMGEMLLRANCIKDRRCDSCDFESECIVRRTMYSKFRKQPAYVKKGSESIGYVLECENYETQFARGDALNFQLLLFGSAIVYLNLFLQAFYALGMQGIGSGHARFQVLSVKNTNKEDLLVNGSIYMKKYTIHHISDYVSYRMDQFKKSPPEGILKFKTPLTLKYRREFLQEFHMAAITAATWRRIYMLACFEGIQDGISETISIPIPNIQYQEHRFVSVKRYSTSHGDFMYLKGIEGIVQTDSLEHDALCLLSAGELIHIGKNTSFGFGKYRIT